MGFRVGGGGIPPSGTSSPLPSLGPVAVVFGIAACYSSSMFEPPSSGPLAVGDDRFAPWHPRRDLSPSWEIRDGYLDRDSVQALLRDAALPYAELLHMGCPAWLLGDGCLPWVDVAVASPLLGRIGLDAVFDRTGSAWDPARSVLVAERDRRAAAAIRKHFR